jgi:hypothetical protein
MKLSQSLVALAALSAGVSAEDERYDYVSISPQVCVRLEASQFC